MILRPGHNRAEWRKCYSAFYEEITESAFVGLDDGLLASSGNSHIFPGCSREQLETTA